MFTASNRVALADGGAITLDTPAPKAALVESIRTESRTQRDEEVRQKVRAYIIDSILLGTADKLDDSASLLEAGILDSTGTMELVAFLEDEFGLTVFDSDIVADNLDSVDRVVAFVNRQRK